MHTGLDPLSHDLCTEAANELCDELNDGNRPLLWKVFNKRLVKLHDIQWKPMNVGQLGIARPKIVQCDFEATAAQLIQELLSIFQLVDEGGFRHF